MLINEVLKLISSAFPKLSFVKIPTKRIFRINIAIKKEIEIFKINNGSNIENTEVANIHEKIILFRFTGFSF